MFSSFQLSVLKSITEKENLICQSMTGQLYTINTVHFFPLIVDCKCNHVSHSVDCSYTGLTYIPVRYVPEDTVILDLSHNQIQEVQTDTFSAFSHLSIVRLDHNMINDVQEHAFR